METDKKYILVTGGAGYIGSHTVVALIEKGFTPVILDDFRNSNKDVIQRLQTITKQEIIYFNIACQDQPRLRGVLEQFPASGVIHFAADKAVGESVEKPLKYFDNNFGSLISVLELIQEYDLENFVFSSSCAVYGDPEIIPVNEESPVSYNSPYGYTEEVCAEMREQFSPSCRYAKAASLRYFSPVGAHESGLSCEESVG